MSKSQKLINSKYGEGNFEKYLGGKKSVFKKFTVLYLPVFELIDLTFYTNYFQTYFIRTYFIRTYIIRTYFIRTYLIRTYLIRTYFPARVIFSSCVRA
jgi:hypothetical protein